MNKSLPVDSGNFVFIEYGIISVLYILYIYIYIYIYIYTSTWKSNFRKYGEQRVVGVVVGGHSNWTSNIMSHTGLDCARLHDIHPS